MKHGYLSDTQTKNLAWSLPRPKPDRYKGGMPLYCEDWLIKLGADLLKNPDPEILNVFCGRNRHGLRVDIKSEVKPDIQCDAHEISKHVTGPFDLILADPPYSTEEARDIYQTPKLDYKKWTAECAKLLRKGGLLIVYHKFVMPNPDAEKFVVAKRVFIGNRPYHLPRVAIYFRKK